MTIEELEQLKADGMIDDRKYQQMKSAIEMQGYQPGQQAVPSNAYDMSNYGKNLQAQAQPMEQNFNPSFGYDAQAEKIAKLESQIAQIKERIARNTRALTGKSYEDANKKLAALEMDKIGVRLNRQNNTDPTMLWRWNQQRLDTANANNQVKGNSAANFNNKMAMLLGQHSANSTEGIEQQIRNMEAAIVEGQNLGVDVRPLINKKNELAKSIYPDLSENDNSNGRGTADEHLAGDLDTILANAKNSQELEAWLNKNKANLRAKDQIPQVEKKIAQMKKAEASKAAFNNMVAWVEKQSGKKWNTLSTRMQDTYKRMWKNRGK